MRNRTEQKRGRKKGESERERERGRDRHNKAKEIIGVYMLERVI